MPLLGLIKGSDELKLVRRMIDERSVDRCETHVGQCDQYLAAVVRALDALDESSFFEPVEPVEIKSVSVVGKFDRQKVEAQVKAAEAAAKAAKEKANAEKNKEMRDYAKKIEEETGTKAVTTESGLMYIDLKVGEGPTPQKTDRVEVHYTGWLLDGTKFDSSVDRGQPFTFSLTGGVIQGWLEGVATMKVGGKRKLIIPSDLGYGKRGSGSRIPPDSVLVFDVELLGIK